MTAKTDSRTAIVTGAGKRVGKAIAEALLASGWTVVAHVHHDPDDVPEGAVKVAADLEDPASAGTIIAAAKGLPPLRLLVCGAGHDAIPLVRQASELGWHVVVVDVRKALLTAERFPGAAEFTSPDPAVAAEALAPDERTAVILMNHNYLRDIAYLRSFLQTPLDYLGVLGPRGRTEQMLAEIGAPEAIARLHAPAGLDIGADGPEEVAHAIIAEILAVTRRREGRPLRDRGGPIHEPG